MSFIAGIKAKDGYLFVTDDLACGASNNKDMVKISNYCGALILTSNGEQLKRLKEVLQRYIDRGIGEADDLSDDIVNKLILSLQMEFQDDNSYKTMPLTFLLLIVGTNRMQQGRLEYVYIRNRVKERIERDGVREFTTVFDIEQAIPAGNIFYGESNIIEYLAEQLSCQEQHLDIVKLMACFSMTDLNNDDLSPDLIRMASLSEEKGFIDIDTEEVLSLMEKSRGVHPILEKGLRNFLLEEQLTTDAEKKG